MIPSACRRDPPAFGFAYQEGTCEKAPMPDSARYDCVLVTGASSGLGEEFAWQIAGQARKLVLVARRRDPMDHLARRIVAAVPGIEVFVHTADLANAKDREELLASLSGGGLVPDLLINNAGLGDYGEFVTSEWPRVEAMLRVNMEALTHLTHALVPGMIRRGGGAVINVSSLASLLPIPDFAVYAATKAYVSSFSEALRIELRPHHIPVLAVCPGPVHTGFGEVAKRSVAGRDIPGREWFFVPKETVVAEALAALHRDRARVYPALRTAAAALVISAMPLLAIRAVMALRPRR